MQNVLSKHGMFERFGGGETSKQGHAVETISSQANNVGQFTRPLIYGYLYCITFMTHKNNVMISVKLLNRAKNYRL